MEDAIRAIEASRDWGIAQARTQLVLRILWELCEHLPAKNVSKRPNYEQLLANDFIKEHTTKETDVVKFVEEILALKKP